MYIVLFTALGVGGATVLGAVIGFLFQEFSRRYSNVVLSFAAGVMLAAAVLSLIIPALSQGAPHGLWYTLPGIFAGAVCLHLLDKAVPGMHRLLRSKKTTRHTRKVLLFVMAIAIHNLPEGIAAGVGFGGGNLAEAMMIAGSIALQNIPEGMVIIAPMLSAGISPGKTFLYAMSTGLIEVVGTLLGYFALRLATAVLPFALAFAGGTMLYVISDQMIPETHQTNRCQTATYALLAGFCFMLVFDYLV